MANLTNKNIEFLSNQELIGILRSILDEIDVVASSGAHRSATYLAVSAIEGLFGELLKLLGLQPEGDFGPPGWPLDDETGKPKALSQLTLEEKDKILREYRNAHSKRSRLNLAGMEKALQDAKALPKEFESLYGPVRNYRNYMHPERELKDRKPIAQSIGQLALACLNALIEEYGDRRFVAAQMWRREHGTAQAPGDNVIHMSPNPGDHVALLVSEQPADRFREMTFRVMIPHGMILNFVYSYFSLNNFMAARIEGREGADGKGYDNGRLHCTRWRVWSIIDRYTEEPDPRRREHKIRVVLDPPGDFAVIVDDVELKLEGGAGWDFDPKGRVGFMAELGKVFVLDLKVQAR